MKRIIKKEFNLEEIECIIGEDKIILKNGKTVEKKLNLKDITLERKDNKLIICGKGNKKTIARINTVISHLKNMVKGLKKGFCYELKVVYSHFPMSIHVKGNTIEIHNFLGKKRVLSAKIIGDDTEIEIKGKDIFVKGNNKEHVSQTAANIEAATRTRYYDRRVFQDGIFIVRKCD